MAVLTRSLRLAVLAFVFLAPAAARAQLASPGELSKAHASLDGMATCTKCHLAGKQLSAALCLDCHVELKRRVEAHRGFHGKMGETDRSSCQTCHHEHEGRSYALVEWKPSKERFDHARTGWPLRGKHAQQKCNGCHDPKHLVEADIVALLKSHPASETYMGLGNKCTTCHFDEHRGQETAPCESCHTELGWKPAPKFDHGKTKYPLTGSHAKVACKDCHSTVKDDAQHPAFPAPRANTFLKLEGVAHGQCSECHEDPHAGRFGRRCDGCHVTDGWKSIKKTAEERAFHDKTKFPLKGMHANVACASCHGPFGGRPAKFKGLEFGKCTDCHRDAHQGQLAQPVCERCHSVEGFKPASFEIEDHAKTSYPLLGAHAAVACDRCHPKDPKLAATSHAEGTGGKGAKAPTVQSAHDTTPLAAVVLRLPGKTARCEGCHSDPHGGQFNDVTDGCAKCHNVSSFKQVAFDHDKNSRFPLTGKHRNAACAGCHRPTKVGKGGDVVRYKPLDMTCAACHVDAHYRQLGTGGCERCHTTLDFKKTTFAHNDPRFTSFALDGRHAKVGCDKCHALVPVTLATGVVKVRKYKPLARACEGCHSDFHHGDFKDFQP